MDLCVKKFMNPSEMSEAINNIICFLKNNDVKDSLDVETVPTYEDIVLSGSNKLVVVLVDSNNNNSIGIYYWDGTTLTQFQTNDRSKVLHTDNSGNIVDNYLKNKDLLSLMISNIILQKGINFTKVISSNTIVMIGTNTLLPNRDYIPIYS